MKKEIKMEDHLGLVTKVAREEAAKYFTRYSHTLLQEKDMINEGVIGLAYAISHFNAEVGCMFSTYATRYVKDAIRRAVRQHISPQYLAYDDESGLMDEEEPLLIEEVVADPSVDADQEREDIKEQVAVMLEELTPDERRIIILHRGFDGERERSVAEVAEILGVSPTAINKRLNKIYAKCI